MTIMQVPTVSSSGTPKMTMSASWMNAAAPMPNAAERKPTRTPVMLLQVEARPVKEESKDWDTTENLYIEGDNLDALKPLQESYLHRVNMIYIDIITQKMIQFNYSCRAA